MPDVSWCDEVEEEVEGDPGPDPLAEPRARLAEEKESWPLRPGEDFMAEVFMPQEVEDDGGQVEEPVSKAPRT